MSDTVLTTVEHKCVHGFKLALVGDGTLVIAGAKVVRSSDLLPAAFAACTDPNTKCASFATAATSSLLRVNGVAVALETGLASNAGAVSVTALPDPPIKTGGA